MIGAPAAAAVALFVATSPLQSAAATPVELGETIFLAGACNTFGWKADLSLERPLFEAFEAAHPELRPADITAEAYAGAGALQMRLDAGLAAIRTTADMDAWTDAMADRCDAIAIAWPTLLARTTDTPTRWAETRAKLARGYVPAD